MKIILAFFAMFLGCFFCWVPSPILFLQMWRGGKLANLIKAFHLLLGVSLFANAFNLSEKSKTTSRIAEAKNPIGLLLAFLPR